MSVMSDQYSNRSPWVHSPSPESQMQPQERRIPVMAADGIVINRIERPEDSEGNGYPNEYHQGGSQAQSGARDGDTSASEDLELPGTTPEEMIALALGQPNHWALRERPTLQMRSHSNGTCTPCMFFMLCNRCHFGQSCGCCHATSHRSRQTLKKFRFTTAAHVRSALYPRRSSKQEGKEVACYSASSASASTMASSAMAPEVGSIQMWLLEMDGGSGDLTQYQACAEANFDNVAQVVRIYARVDCSGQTAVDPLLFQDFGIRKVGHQRLIEKWFRNRASLYSSFQ